MNNELVITVDGKLQKQRIRKLYKATKQASVTLSRNIAQSLAVAAKNLSDDTNIIFYDLNNHTSLYKERQAKVKQAKYQAFRSQYGL